MAVREFSKYDDLPEVDHHASEANQRNADYISVRRLSERLGATTLDAFSALCDLLQRMRPDRYGPSIYRTLTTARCRTSPPTDRCHSLCEE